MLENEKRISVYCECPERMCAAETFAQQNGLFLFRTGLDELVREAGYLIDFSFECVLLRYSEGNKPRQLKVDFVSGGNDHRRKYGGGKGQAIAKAVGLHNSPFKPHVLDATAGQGGDAFVLASLGCRVGMLERSPVAYVLLEDALQRGRRGAEKDEPELDEIFSRMTLSPGDFMALPLPDYDVVYLDPMFPERKKNALVKKEMRVFHDIIGKDLDADSLLEKAVSIAKYRVVVKRPLVAPYLAEKEPSYQLKGKSSRFDIYVNKTMRQTI